MSESKATPAEQRAHLKKIIAGTHSAFMVTHAGDQLHGRPMATAKVEDDLSRIWFASVDDTGKVSELKDDSAVFLGYTNSSGSDWATISGRARLVKDSQKAKELWSPIWKNWFTGPDDPKLMLIAVTPESAEYWDGGSKLLIMAKLAFTAVTGKTVDEGEHAAVKL